MKKHEILIHYISLQCNCLALRNIRPSLIEVNNVNRMPRCCYLSKTNALSYQVNHIRFPNLALFTGESLSKDNWILWRLDYWICFLASFFLSFLEVWCALASFCQSQQGGGGNACGHCFGMFHSRILDVWASLTDFDKLEAPTFVALPNMLRSQFTRMIHLKIGWDIYTRQCISRLLFIKMFSVHPKWTLRIEQPRGPSSSPPWRPPPSRRASPQPCTPRTTASPASPGVDADEDGMFSSICPTKYLGLKKRDI